MAIISKGITLSWLPASTDTTGVFTAVTGAQASVLTNLVEIPEIGNASAGYEQIDITTLADSKMKNMNGLESASEVESLEFKFLYDKAQFSNLDKTSTSDYKENGDGTKTGRQWIVTLPDGSACKFFASKHAVRLEGVGVNAALSYILSITPDAEQGEFTWDFTGSVSASAE